MGRKSISESISLILAGVLIGLAADAVQATAVEPVTAMIAQKRGYGILIDLTTEPLRYMAQAIVARNSFIDRHAETCRRLIMGARIGSATAHSSPQHLGLWEESHAPPDRSPPEKEIVFDPSYSQLI